MKIFLIVFSLLQLSVNLLVGVTVVFSETVGSSFVGGVIFISVASLFVCIFGCKNIESPAIALSFLCSFMEVFLLNKLLAGKYGGFIVVVDLNFWVVVVLSGVLSSLLLLYGGLKHG